MKKQMMAGLLAAALAVGAALPVSALLNGNPAPTASKEETQPESGAAGAFTGSIKLSRYLYEQFSANPDSLSVPVELFSSEDIQGCFDELGDAAIEAYIQNGLTDYVVDFQYNYTSGDPGITMHITYNDEDAASRRSRAQELDRKAGAIVAAVVTPDMTQRQKAQALNNYVAQNVKYDFNGFREFQAGKNVYSLQTAYAGLVEGSAICQGFARAYKLLCDKAGIPCVVLFGATKQFGTTHAWCRVNLDGVWETVDSSNPQLAINHVGSFAIPAEVVGATLQPDETKTLVDSQAGRYLA